MRSHNLLLSAVLAVSAFSFLAGGCAKEKRHDVVPATALLGAEGEKKLTYTTASAGTLYVYDQVADRLVYSGQVESGRSISIDPEKNEVSVDGTLVQDKTLTKGHNHRIFFQPRYR